MARVVMACALAFALTGCGEEVIAVHESNITTQFSQLNKNGWAVARNDQTHTGGSAVDPNLHIVKEADFSGLTFHTNFQVDEPKAAAPQHAATQPAAANGPPPGQGTLTPAFPFGAPMPGR